MTEGEYFAQFIGINEGEDTCDHFWIDWYSPEGLGKWCIKCRVFIPGHMLANGDVVTDA